MRGLLVAIVAAALSLPFVHAAGIVDAAAPTATPPCAVIALTTGARVPGPLLADCLADRFAQSIAFRTRISATGDRDTVADVQVAPLLILARRGTDRTSITTASSDDSLFSTFVRRAAPSGEIIRLVRSVEWWQVVRRGSVDDADGEPRTGWRLRPVDRLRFDDSAARSVSLHLTNDVVPVRFRATTTAVGFEVVYTQRWSRWWRVRDGG